MIILEEMPIWINCLISLVTIVGIGIGAHCVVESASRLAKYIGISELSLGLTIVAFGTSAPEFTVTLISAFNTHGDIAVGNIVGSNNFNLGLILGGCAFLRRIPVSRTLVRRDGMILAGTAMLLLVLIGWDLHLDRHDGFILFILLVVYLGILFKKPTSPKTDNEDVDDSEVLTGRRNILMRASSLLILGLSGIIAGSYLLVGSATAIARELGVSEWVIGVTIVAAGTSVPELATSLVAVVKGRYAISAGSLIGSDIFNLLGVLGLAGMFQPVCVDSTARISLAALSGTIFLVVIFMRTGWRLSRMEGLLLFTIAILRWGLDLSTNFQ